MVWEVRRRVRGVRGAVRVPVRVMERGCPLRRLALVLRNSRALTYVVIGSIWISRLAIWKRCVSCGMLGSQWVKPAVPGRRAESCVGSLGVGLTSEVVGTWVAVSFTSSFAIFVEMSLRGSCSLPAAAGSL